MIKLPIVSAEAADLSPFDRRWLADALKLPLPVETRATCHSCAMLPDPAREPSELDVAFRADTKCCTIVPFLDNFRVGAILQSDACRRDVVMTRIAARHGVSPLGVGQSDAERQRDEAMRADGAFGQRADHRCPYYVDPGGLCGIWEHRSASCASYHCRFVRGVIGATFWRALQNMLGSVERTVARWCLTELELDDDALLALFPAKPGPIPGASLADPMHHKQYERCWGNWHGRERDFFIACAERAATLSWADIERIAGPDVAILKRTVNLALQRWHDDSLPTVLRAGPFRAESVGPLALRVRAYSTTDTADFPMTAIAALPLFDGRATGDAVAAARETFGTDLDDDMLRRLFEHGALR